MQLQFVYGNPKKVKKVKRIKKRSLTVAKKRKKVKRKVAAKKRVATRKSVRVVKATKARVVRRATRRKKKNPELVYAKAFDVVGKTKSGRPKLKLIKKYYAGKTPTRGEITYASGATRVQAEKLRQKGLSKKRKKAIRGKVNKMKRRLSRMRNTRAFVMGKARSLAQAIKLDGKHGTVSRTYKKNPEGGSMNKLETALGMPMVEVGGLAAGGLLYGAVNSAVARYAKPVHSALVKVPVVGTALPTLLLGAIANYIGERQNIGALKVVGKGLVGAAVVGIGVNAAQMVPFLRPALPASRPVSGLGYEEMYGDSGEPCDGQLGSDSADFGGIDYTMEGIDYTMEGMGADEADFGGIDYTMEGIDYTMEGMGADEADFGVMPEGLGEGQLG